MKTSVIIRFILAAAIATLGCIGFLAKVDLAGFLFLVPMWLLPITPPKVQREISPIAMFWLLFGAFFVAGILMATLSILPHFDLPVTLRGVNRVAITVAMWLYFMWVIYYRWRKAKANGGA